MIAIYPSGKRLQISIRDAHPFAIAPELLQLHKTRQPKSPYSATFHTVYALCSHNALSSYAN